MFSYSIVNSAKRFAAVLFFVFFSQVLLSQNAYALDADDKYCLYSKKSFQGRELCSSQQQANWVGWNWYNRIKSIEVQEGYELVAFPHPWQTGRPTIYSGSTENIRGWKKRIASYYVREKQSEQERVCFYAKKNYRGERFCTNDDRFWLGWFWDKRISSVSIPSGFEVTLYRYWGFYGSNVTLNSSTPNLGSFNNRTSSFKIEQITNNADADGDGVLDNVDQCADTPLGETVDANGCSLSQLDTDNDSINDAIDQCPATPAGETVNTEGCSPTQLDTDNDSVNDAVDQCPATPAGETANAYGCAPSQLDTDSDGVNDAIDQCPVTPSGEVSDETGCSPTQRDTDNDGVNDAIDQCPATPVGEGVDAQGCGASQLDADNDGANDAIDQCPATPAGETANAQGCSPSQLDSDNDGVNDAIDQCPATPAGETANAQGCSPSQLDTDNDGVNDAIDQCPATPAGETANANGCSPSQLDTDNDTINDAIDQCPATPVGAAVNAQGCSLSQLDSDNDSVSDAIDQCAATPVGESVNAQGCSSSQLDTDSDGVNDNLDQCPSTPTGESVDSQGCALSQIDTDGDGVFDDADVFPNDPTESVDTDGDGIGDNADVNIDGDDLNNDLDAFPLDPTETEDLDDDGIGDNVDTDRDGDGVLNDADAFPNDATESSDLDGDGIGDNADTDVDGDGVENDQDAFPLDPVESADIDGDGIGDNADTDRDGDGVPNENDYFPSDPTASSVPTVQITSPGTLITVGSSPITLQGTVDDPDATLIINGVEVPQSNGTFTADVALEEGINNIIVRAIDNQNHEGTATITVSLDKTPPYITLQSPKEGDTVYQETISVSGLVNDIVRGTVSADDAQVSVNGQQASVANRSYLAENITLTTGENIITITAADAVGNQAEKQITVNYQAQTSKQIMLVYGQAQTGGIRSGVADPLIVKLTDNGSPVVDKIVIFRVTEGDGLLEVGTDKEGNGAIVKTNANGEAQVSYQLGSRAGSGNHRVTAKAVGFDGEVEFYASANYDAGIQMGVIAGNNQRGAVKQPLPQPLVIAVTDIGANLIPNAEIEWEVVNGGGSFANGETKITNTTDIDGRSSINVILGDLEGIDEQRVVARLVGTPAIMVFTLSGLMPGDPGETSISGVVLDNQDKPMPNVTIRVDGSTRQAISDEQGQFTITEAPVGPVHLLVEGSTTTREGEWPSLSYNIVTVPGVDNPMVSPVYLVEIDTENAVYVGLEDKIVTHPEIPGFELDVKAGSVTFPNGSKEGYLSITRVNANKVPMAPPNGMQPQLIVTIQPHGAKFDPPAKLSIPNTDGHVPNSEVEMYSYDHDLEEFVTIGLGTVTKDGQKIVSNDGVGVIKAGWHCGSGPGGSAPVHNCGECAECDGTKCQVHEDGELSNSDSCKFCVNGKTKDVMEDIAGPNLVCPGLSYEFEVAVNLPGATASIKGTDSSGRVIVPVDAKDGDKVMIEAAVGACSITKEVSVSDGQIGTDGERLVCGRRLSSCVGMFLNKQEGERWTKKYVKELGNGYGGGCADAARHAYTSAISTLEYGAETTKAFTDGHEVSVFVDCEDNNMDLMNNAVGRTLVGECTTEVCIQNAVVDALKRGDLMVWRGRGTKFEKLISSNSCNVTYQKR